MHSSVDGAAAAAMRTTARRCGVERPSGALTVRMAGTMRATYMMGMATPPVPRRLQFLLASDLSPESLPHVALGARLAQRLGGHTTLYHAAVAPRVLLEESLPIGAMTPAVDLPAVRQQAREVAALVPVDRPLHVEVESALDTRSAILAAAARTHADMLLLPTHGRSGLTRALLGSVAEQVLRHSDRPVVLLTDRMVQRDASRSGAKGAVMATTDMSADAAAGLVPAADLARRLQLTLQIVSVLPAREGPPLGGGLPVAAAPAEPRQRLHERMQQLRQLASGLGPDLHVEVAVAIGDDPVAAILAKAEELEVSLLVVATHGRTGIARAIKGSVAEQLVRHAAVPVVCVPVPSAT